MSKTAKELAYIYDLYIVPTWRDCFDQLFNEKSGIPKSGEVLVVNCGTGGHAIELSKHLLYKGSVVAVDENPEAIKLAEAKTSILKIDNLKFSVASSLSLPMSDNTFDLIILDASLSNPNDLAKQIDNLKRVAKPGAKLAVYLTTRGSFDEFFSIFWEALYKCQMADELLTPLEGLINERLAVEDSEKILKNAGLKNVSSYIEKKEFFYKTAKEFFGSPLIEEFCLAKWFSILPKGKQKAVRQEVEKIIEQDREGIDFDVSIKATLLTAQK